MQKLKVLLLLVVGPVVMTVVIILVVLILASAIALATSPFQPDIFGVKEAVTAIPLPTPTPAPAIINVPDSVQGESGNAWFFVFLLIIFVSLVEKMRSSVHH